MPQQPSDFTMMLRKRVTNARLAGVRQQGFDRIVVLTLEKEETHDLVRTLATKLNIGGKYSEELCARTGFADPTQGGNMRDWYDNPVLEDIFAEQAQMLSYGPLGALGNASVELTEELPSEALALMQDYLKGQIGTMEFVTKAEAIRLRNAPVQLARPEA